MAQTALGRREFLAIGALAGFGLGLAGPVRAASFGRAKSCLFLFLQGGPSHLDSWDPKPSGTAQVRGEFRAIRSRVPGTLFCEHLPRLAALADRFALIRSCTHDDVEHNSAAHACLTGRMHPRKGQIVPPSADDFPPYGAVVSSLRSSARPALMPAWVTMPAYLINSGVPFPSQNAGFLGGAFDPLAIRSDPSAPGFQIQGLSVVDDLPPARLEQRRGLALQLDALAGPRSATAVRTMESCYRRGHDLIVSPAARTAFTLDAEPAVLRDRYGRTPFGQSVLLGRRLIEAGVPMVTVAYTNDQPRRPGCAISWDTHEDNFRDLKDKLLPDLDRTLSALLDDMQERGLLSETLVVVAGEFGRAATINANAGRDHWTGAYTALWAGAGVHGGLVHGASDAIGAFPTRNAVSPADLAATLYHALGIDPHRDVHDRHGRPHTLTLGEPIAALFD